MPDVHARLSASGSAKWLNCPGSLKLEEEFSDTGSVYAEEGTKAHALGELKLRRWLGKINQREYSDMVKMLGEIPTDMEKYTDSYRDYVIEQHNSVKGEKSIAIEMRLDYSEYAPEGFGTGDVVIAYNGGIHIIDLKYGKGVVVDAKENPQLRLYGLGACYEYDLIYDIENISYTIYQPRVDNISTYTESIGELYKWGNEVVKPGALKALEDNAECIAGKYCDSHFCKARAVCRAYNERMLKLAKYDFSKPAKLTNAEISDVLEISQKVKSWCEVVEAYALEKAIKGEKFPGYKVVEGKSNRKYTDEAAVASELSKHYQPEEYMEPAKVKTITNVEKLLGKERFKELLGKWVVKPQGKPTLVPEGDKRPEIGSVDSAKADFDIKN